MPESFPSLAGSPAPPFHALAPPGGLPGAPVVPGLALRDLVPVHDAPLTHVWRATGADDEPLTVHVVRAEAHALVPDGERLLSHLATGIGFSGPPLHVPLWAKRLADGRCAYATRWFDRIPAVDAVRETLLPPAALVETTANLLASLAELHRQGSVLGIIGPSSLAYVPELNTFFVDGAGVFPALLSAGARREEVARVAGVPLHIAPEVLVPGAAVDARADVFSVGTSLYELLTERAPFGGRTTATMMVSVLVDTDAEEIAAPGGPVRELVDALLRAIERDPDDRWPSAEAFAAAMSGAGRTTAGPSRRAPGSRSSSLDGWRTLLAQLWGRP